MERKLMFVVLATVTTSATLSAATVTINAPAGSVTNAFAFVSGEDSLAVNTGATGGTVRLNPNNLHTGGTTLGSGTLVVSQPARAGEPHELGAGPFTQAGGTLRYAGPAGGVWTGAITNQPAVDSAAVVWQIDNDLTMAGDVQQPSGCFIKSGKGTLTFTHPFTLGGCTTAYGSGIYGGYTDFSPDRAPTKGYAPFTIADGTVVIDTPYDVAVTNVLSGVDVNLAIGQGTTASGEETTGILIISNGITRSAGRINIGSTNGRKSNSTTRLEPTLRVLNGATLLVGPTGNKVCYLGVMWSDKTAQWNAPRLEVSGAGTKMYCNGISTSYHQGANTTIIVSDGGDLSSYGSSLVFSSNSGSADTTNEVVVTGSGSYLRVRTVNNNKNAVSTVRILDGGVLEMWNFQNDGGGKLNLIVDGGVWRHRYKAADGPHFPSTMTSVKVGPGGFHTYFNGGTEDNPVVWEKGIEPLDDSGTDGGLHITKGSSAMPPLLMNAANTYCGPTEITFTRVYLGKDGKLPSGTALSIYGSNGGLIITNGVQTVGSFMFGTPSSATAPILGFDRESRLDVTGDVTVGALNMPPLYLFETRGLTDGLSTPGVYTFITASAASFDALHGMTRRFDYINRPDNVEYTAYAVLEDGRAKLKVAVDRVVGTASVEGTTLVLPSTTNSPLSATSEQLAAADTILSNPQHVTTGAGTVDLGALDGFAAGGRLVVGSGLTRVSDLSFVKEPDDLVLTIGTLSYTGASTAIPGFSIQGTSYRSAVLDVADANTTLTVTNIVLNEDASTAMTVNRGALTKLGPGELHIGGTGEISLEGTTMVDYNAEAGVVANGDGPRRGFRSFNVNGGSVTIGTQDDPLDAPTVVFNREVSVGSRSHQAGQGIQTAGTMTMNNGTLAISNTLYVSYYSGNPLDVPDAHLYPTFTLNGGEVYAGQLRMGHGSSNQTDSPSYIQHGGTNTIGGLPGMGMNGAIYVGYHAAPSQGVYRATFLVDGGLVTCTNHVYVGNAADTMGADLIITNGGILASLGNVTLNHKNTRETNTLVLASGGTLRCRTLYTGSSAFAYPAVARFDGGIFQPYSPAGTTVFLRYFQHAYLGKDGLTVDLSHQHELDGTVNRDISLHQAFEPDPDLPEGVTDGGITFTGKGTASTYNTFCDGTFKGGIHVRNGARYLIAGPTAAAPFAADFEPGTIVSTYVATNTIGSLTLGEAGATEPITLEVRVDQAGSVGVVVSNALSVLSPVAVTTMQGTFNFNCSPRVGMYTALVYNASNADVDLSLFKVEPQTRFTMTARQELIEGGDLDGMKAVVVTFAESSEISGGGPVWTSVATGGAWTESANWDGFDAPGGETARAVFKPATAVNVPVTVPGAGVTVGTLDFSASSANKGYALSGGTVTLGGKGYAAKVINNSGTNTLASPVVLAGDTSLLTTNGNALCFTGGVSGNADLEVNTHIVTNAGHVNLKVSPSYTGKITTGSGRVVMDDLSFIKSADQLTIGLGTLLYTGPDMEIPGFKFTSIAGRPAVFQSDSDVTVTESITRTGTAAFLKLGTGTLHLNGTGTLSVNTKHDNSNKDGLGIRNYVYDNGDGPTRSVRGFAVSAGTFVMGEVGDDANAPTLTISSNTEIGIGNYTSTKNGSATFIMNNGTINLTSQLYLDYYCTAGNTLTFRQNGGRIISTGGLNCAYNGTGKEDVNTLFEINGGEDYFNTYLRMGSSEANTFGTRKCRIVMNGGSLVFGGDAAFAYHAAARTNEGVIDLNGGLFAVTGSVDFASYDGDKVTLRLNPGATFRANAISQTATTAETAFYGNGGTFQPICKTAAGQTLNAAFSLYSSTNGLVVDTSATLNGASYTIAQPVLHDPALDAAADGGLVKRGLGTLTLSGANTYTGGTVVEGGVLALSGTGSMGTESSLSVANGAIFDLGGTAHAVADVTASGLVRNGGLTVMGGFLVGESVLSVVGDLTFGNALTIDFAGRQGLDLDAGEPIAVVTGTATLPNSATATNAGDVTKVVFARDGDVVYAVAAPSGTVIIFR